MRSDCSDIGHLLVHGQGSLFYFRRQEPAADSRTGRQLQWAWRALRRRRRSAWVPFLHQPRIMRRVNDHDATSLCQPMLGNYFDLAIDLDATAGHWLSHQDGLACEAERYRVTIAAIAEHAVFGHATIFHIAGVVIGLLVEEQQPLQRQALVGDLSRGGVHLAIDLFHPGVSLLVQVFSADCGGMMDIGFVNGPEVDMDPVTGFSFCGPSLFTGSISAPRLQAGTYTAAGGVFWV